MATIKAFKNLQEIEKNLNEGTKFALQNTLIELAEEFRNIIKEDVYNVYQPAWYERSWWLLEPKVIKYYIKSAFGKGWVGNVVLDPTQHYFTNEENFVHSNPYFGDFASTDFIDMLNGRTKYSASTFKNVFNFPVIDRGSFLEDFEKYAETAYPFIFQKYFERFTGIKLQDAPTSPQVKSILKKPIATYKGYGNRNVYSGAKQNAYTPDISDSGAYGVDMYI